MADENDVVTAAEAIAMLPDGDDVHTFRNPNGMLIGADWPRGRMVEALESARLIKRTGDLAQRMGHGIVIENGGSLLFIATRPEEPRDAS